MIEQDIVLAMEVLEDTSGSNQQEQSNKTLTSFKNFQPA